MVILGDIYLKREKKLLYDDSEILEDSKDLENENDDFVDRLIIWIFRETGYEIPMSNDFGEKLIDKFNYVINEINDMDSSYKEKMSKYLKGYLSDCLSFIRLGGNIENLNGKEDKKNNKYDYSGLSDFWFLNYDGNDFILTPNTNYFKTNYTTEEALNNDFIKLSEFLKRAKFVGREFKRTKPLPNNYSFCQTVNDGVKHIVLYATNELFLARRTGFIGHPDAYILIEKRYIEDGNYAFFGPIHNEYNNTIKIYNDIREQLKSTNKEYKELIGSIEKPIKR